VNQATLPAVHRIEAEVRSGMLHAFSGIQGTTAQLFKPQRTVVIGVKRNPRMIIGVHPQQLHRHQFHRQQQFGLIGQQQIDIAAMELYHQIRVFKLRSALVTRPDLKSQIEACIGDHLVEERFDARSGFVNRILSRQAFFLPSRFVFEA
jgi:hypothetical protein